MAIDTKDLKLDDDLDLFFKDGDLVFEDSTTEHFEALFDSKLGEYKTDLRIGVGLHEFLNAPMLGNKIRLNNRIKRNLQYDYWKETQFSIDKDIANNTFKIKANGIRLK